jgi:hypothetical protein
MLDVLSLTSVDVDLTGAIANAYHHPVAVAAMVQKHVSRFSLVVNCVEHQAVTIINERAHFVVRPPHQLREWLGHGL